MSKVPWQQRHGNYIDTLQRRGIDPEPVLRYSLLSNARIRGLVRACDAIVIDNVPGKTVEIGCAAGGTSRLIAQICGRTHFACDTFDGLVDVGSEDPDLYNGMFRNPDTAVDAVTARLADLPNVTVVQGAFPGAVTEAMDTFALVHLDVDTYRSMTDCFACFAPRVNAGGFIVLDDVMGRRCTRGGAQFWAEVDLDGFDTVDTNEQQAIIRRIR